MTYNLTGEQRVHILNLLPEDCGSLKESIQIKRIRDQVLFSDYEEEQIGLDRTTGSFNPQGLEDLEERKFEFSGEQEEVLAACLVRREEEGNVPTADAFVELVMQFEDVINRFKKDLG